MIVNNFGTLIYSFLFGEKVGQDIKGNKFFINRGKKNKKWVLFKSKVDPTQLSVEWHQWLTDLDKFDVPKTSLKNYKWQKDRDSNRTGTKKAYHPKSSNEKIKTENSTKIWSPN